MSRDEVLQDVQAFAEVGSDGRFDDFAAGLGHQAAHAGKLTNLLFGSARAGVGHNVNGVDVSLFVLIFEGFEKLVGNFFGNVAPDGDDFVVALAVGNGAIEILLLHFDDFFFGVFDEVVLIAGNKHVVDADGDAGHGGVMEAELFQVIQKDDGVFQAEAEVGVVNKLLHALLFQQAVNVGKFFRQVGIENDATHGGLNELTFHANGNGVRDVLIVIGGGEIDHFAGIAQTDGSEQFDFAGFESKDDFIGGSEDTALTLGAGFGLGQIINAEDHILRGNGEGQPVRGRKNISRAEHEHGGFDLRFRGKWNVHSHLVAVKIGVERGANQRMDTDGLALNKHRLKSLNAETVKGGSAIEHHGMLANHVFENVPYDGILLLDHFLGLLDGRAVAMSFELVVDKGLEKLQRHFLGQAALMEF